MIRALIAVLLFAAAPSWAATHNIWSNIAADSGQSVWSCVTNGVTSGDTIWLHNHTEADWNHVIGSQTEAETRVRTARIHFDDCKGMRRAGTYSQSGTTITVTLSSHGLTVGDSVSLDFTSGTASDGDFTVATAAAGSYTVTAGSSATTSGNVTTTARITIRNHPDDNGPVVMSTTNNSTTSLRLRYSDWVTVDGTGGWDGMTPGAYCGYPEGRTGCGIQIISEAVYTATNYMSFNEIEPDESLREDSLDCTNGTEPDGCYPGSIGMTVKGVEIDGSAALPTVDYANATCASKGGTLSCAPFNNSVTGKVGIYTHAANSSAVGLSDPIEAEPPWYEGFLITQMYIHDVFGEAIYSGNNTSTECGGGSKLCPRNRDMEVSYNLVERTGRDAINLKIWVEGGNSIHHNTIVDAGFRLEDWELPSIAIANSTVDIYNNTVIRARGQGINVNNKSDEAGFEGAYDDFEPYMVSVWNNVVHQAGYADTVYSPCPAARSGTYSRSGTTITVTLSSHGYTVADVVDLDFTSGAATDGLYTVATAAAGSFTVTSSTSGTTSGNVTVASQYCGGSTSPQKINPLDPQTPGATEESSITINHNDDGPGIAYIWMNTISDTDGYGVRITNVDTPVVRNNIISRASGTNYIYESSTNGTGYYSESDNWVGTNAAALFVDSTNLNFALQSGSPAIDAANATTIPALDPDFTPVYATDIDGTARPQNGLYDQGAYEYTPPETPVLNPFRSAPRGIRR